MVTRTNRAAWGLAAVLAVVVLGGVGLLLYLQALSNLRQTALVEAARQGNTARVAELLDAGAHVDAPGSVQTVLGGAISSRQVDLVKLLLEHGASATAPVDLSRQADLVKLLLEHGASATAPIDLGQHATLAPLDLAVFEDNAGMIKLLLAHGANVNECQPQTGRTILMNAAWDAHLASVQALLAGGADPNAREPGGLTALYDAAYEGHTAIVRALIAHGAVINPRGRGRWTPLMGAVRGGRPETVKLLLAIGADVNGKGYGNGHTYTALTLARSLEKDARKYPSRSKLFPELNVQNDVVIIRLLKQAGAKE